MTFNPPLEFEYVQGDQNLEVILQNTQNPDQTILVTDLNLEMARISLSHKLNEMWDDGTLQMVTESAGIKCIEGPCNTGRGLPPQYYRDTSPKMSLSSFVTNKSISGISLVSKPYYPDDVPPDDLSRYPDPEIDGYMRVANYTTADRHVTFDPPIVFDYLHGDGTVTALTTLNYSRDENRKVNISAVNLNELQSQIARELDILWLEGQLLKIDGITCTEWPCNIKHIGPDESIMAIF